MQGHLGIGIDTAKKGHDVCIKDHHGRILHRMRLQNRREDVEGFLEIIHDLRQRHEFEAVIVNMEATGVYHLPLYSHLCHFFRVNLWQPRQVKSQDKKNIRRQKSDPRDAATLANLHVTQTPPRTNYDDDARWDTRELVRLHERFSTTCKNLKRRFRRSLFVLFPAWEGLFSDVYGKTSWAILKAYPDPERLVQAGPEAVQCVIHAAVGNRARVTGQDVILHVQSMLSCNIAAQGHVVALRFLMEEIEQLTKRVEELARQIITDWRQVKPTLTFWSHPALSEAASAGLWAEFGDLSRFGGGDPAVAYAGLDNMVYQSGAKRFEGGMSKSGPKMIRTITYRCLSVPRKYVPGLTEHMQKKIGEGKHRNEAIHSASKKLIRCLYGMERSKTYFQSPV